MGVYIKEMEMPATCQECEFAVPGVDSAYCERHEKTAMDFSVAENGRPNWCPLVEVPTHGDLIDREELQHIIGQFSLNWEYGQGVSDCWDALLNAPTIIEAEGET